jgi:hypothetical protein
MNLITPSHIQAELLLPPDLGPSQMSGAIDHAHARLIDFAGQVFLDDLHTASTQLASGNSSTQPLPPWPLLLRLAERFLALEAAAELARRGMANGGPLTLRQIVRIAASAGRRLLEVLQENFDALNQATQDHLAARTTSLLSPGSGWM